MLEIDLELWDQLVANPDDYYVDIHTRALPDGALRGQLRGTSPDTAMASAGRTDDVLVLIGAMALLLAGATGLALRRPGRALGS